MQEKEGYKIKHTEAPVVFRKGFDVLLYRARVVQLPVSQSDAAGSTQGDKILERYFNLEMGSNKQNNCLFLDYKMLTLRTFATNLHS